ncbi:TnsA-like heteromeric transposase endonuclease subunit [Actinoallomurus sp. CA-150999]|uniref:TnsA-like heteromeric transposase endonuclease subunit n=1 Tax=Actinoallomurus sp. CA-150999 TaxID=3239887 RepID=UPI003D8E5E32
MCDPFVWVRYDDQAVREFTLDRLRLSDFIGSVPWRQVRARHGQAHYAGAYVSATTGGFVAYESRLELARLLLADFDPHVRQIYAQPFRLVAQVDGQIRCHVPDFLLVTAAGTGRLVNVKPAARLQDHRVARVLAWPGALAERHGCAQVTIVGAVGPGARHEPDAVADELWRRHTGRDQPLVVLR